MTTLEIIKEIKSIAVVGLSDKAERDSNEVAVFLQSQGYTIYGVHPTVREVQGIKVFKNLCDIHAEIDLVDVFLSSENLRDIVNDIILIKPKYVWLQFGAEDEKVEATLQSAGITVISGKCIMIEYLKYFG